MKNLIIKLVLLLRKLLSKLSGKSSGVLNTSSSPSLTPLTSPESTPPKELPSNSEGMPLKTKIIIVVIALGTSFAFGRYTVPEKIKIETKIVEIEKKQDTSTVSNKKNRKKKTIVVVDIKPDGEEHKTTTITDDTSSDSNKHDNQSDITAVTQDQTKEVIKGSDKVTISGMVGINVLTGLPSYGASVTKPILGPITVGIWGLTPGVCGGSLGLTF